MKNRIFFMTLLTLGSWSVSVGIGQGGAVAKREVIKPKSDAIILEDVPYICQIGRLDCCYVACAMLTGHLSKNYDTLAYPEMMYRTALAYGLVYLPGRLWIPFTWGDEDYQWLAFLYGLSYQRRSPDASLSAQEAWEDFLAALQSYLQKGVAVQTWRSWGAYKEEENKIYTAAGIRPFWWEGMKKKHRPQQHATVIVGMDASRKVVYLNDPGCGWFGTGRGEEVSFEDFRKTIEPLSPSTRYVLRVFTKTDKPPLSPEALEPLIKERIRKKLAGDPKVYDQVKGRIFGQKALEALREDLLPENFARILKKGMEKEGLEPLEIITRLNMGIYQYGYIASVTSDYLEARRDARDWKWMVSRRLLYERLYILSQELYSVTMTEKSLEQALKRSKPLLLQMRTVLNEMIRSGRDFVAR